MITEQDMATTMKTLTAFCDAVRIEIGTFAAEGNTLECDVRHSIIERVETVMDNLDGEIW